MLTSLPQFSLTLTFLIGAESQVAESRGQSCRGRGHRQEGGKHLSGSHPDRDLEAEVEN